MTMIRESLAGQPLALCPEHAASLLAQDMPSGAPDPAMQAVAAASAEFSVQAGERYSVSRGLAVVPVRGILTPNSAFFERWLGWTTYFGLTETMRDLGADEDVRGIVLEIDSPGGAVLGIEAAAAAVASVGKPVHALVHPLATSAAYWIASQATDISLSRGSIVGSIGVMLMTSDPVQPGGARGWQDSVMRSTHARAKNADATQPETAALLQRQLDKSEAEFHAAIAAGRGLSLDGLLELLSETENPRDGGGIFAGPEAVEMGLADVANADRLSFYEAIAGQYAPASSTRRSARSRQALAAVAAARATI